MSARCPLCGARPRLKKCGRLPKHNRPASLNSGSGRCGGSGRWVGEIVAKILMQRVAYGVRREAL